MRARKQDIKFREVLFLTLTKRNGSYYKRLWADVEAFLDALCLFTGVHIDAIRGYEAESGNTHEHIILRIPENELDRWNKRYQRFTIGKAWSWIEKVEPFDMARKEKAYTYVLVKHQPVMPFQSPSEYCPKRYHQCRKGRCTHIATPST